MADALKKAIAGRIDLYEALELNFRDFRDRNDGNSLRELKRRYRTLSLRYHPDKNGDDPDSLEKFHLVSVAASVLVDQGLKREYDEWCSRYLYPDGQITAAERTKREEMIQDLNSRELSSSTDNSTQTDLGSIQAYGEKLRRLKHFEMGYGDWIHLDEHIRKQQKAVTLKPKDKELCTLRLVVEYNVVSEISDLKQTTNWLRNQFPQHSPYFEEVYFSENNSYEAMDDVVVYVVLKSIEAAAKLYHSMRESRAEGILDIQPHIPPTAFDTFKEPIEPNPDIEQQLRNKQPFISID